MAKFFTELAGSHVEFIGRQKIFFVASAPHEGRVNLSPKGMDTFRILGPRRVGYLDATGSGNETSAHLRQNGRVTLMFCAFDGSPLILRLYGRGAVLRPPDGDWAQLRPLFGPELPGERQLVLADIESIQTSCGFAVPFFDYKGDRGQLVKWAEHKGPEGLVAYRAQKNRRSIDGLPTGLAES
ncbi:MAG TPA: pyridoxamine 5'-phosphate oxidase family protein [Opitutaceae bacterium]|nr:pyridoxamine 5'-phosphate oxidase family protein [Opitutaceae bacterium]